MPFTDEYTVVASVRQCKITCCSAIVQGKKRTFKVNSCYPRLYPRSGACLHPAGAGTAALAIGEKSIMKHLFEMAFKRVVGQYTLWLADDEEETCFDEGASPTENAAAKRFPEEGYTLADDPRSFWRISGVFDDSITADRGQNLHKFRIRILPGLTGWLGDCR
jgi:hypothetical protein